MTACSSKCVNYSRGWGLSKCIRPNQEKNTRSRLGHIEILMMMKSFYKFLSFYFPPLVIRDAEIIKNKGSDRFQKALLPIIGMQFFVGPTLAPNRREFEGVKTHWNYNISHYLCFCSGLCRNEDLHCHVLIVFLRKGCFPVMRFSYERVCTEKFKPF